MALYPECKLEDIKMEEGKIDLTPIIDCAPADLTKSQRESVARIVRQHQRTSDAYEVQGARWSEGYRGRYYLSFRIVIKDAWLENDPTKYKMGAIFYDIFRYCLGIRGKIQTMDGRSGKWITNKLWLKAS